MLGGAGGAGGSPGPVGKTGIVGIGIGVGVMVTTVVATGPTDGSETVDGASSTSGTVDGWWWTAITAGVGVAPADGTPLVLNVKASITTTVATHKNKRGSGRNSASP
jgi:hypothetical protein